ncbi:MAG: sigma-70 family RNA polymerase sigma factor [Ruminococcus sp.]|nr:sigma-70 family RNA polymerase sigma factor [Ruminococcus sp.]
MDTQTCRIQQRAEENLGLVHLCANRFRGRGIEYDDLYGAGCIGLMKAARGFDEERGLKFSTYAVPVIIGEIKRLFRDGGAIHVSRSVKERSLRLNRMRDSFAAANGREPTVSELCQISGESYENVLEALDAGQQPMSLTIVTEDGVDEADIPVPSSEQEVLDSISLRRALEKLDERDRKLIFLRYFRDKTQTETAAVLGMTQVQVSRREKKVLAAMRSSIE